MSFPDPITINNEEQNISKVIIIGTYFGKWPIWLPAFLLSCAKNDTIEWLFFTDCEIPTVTFPNIRFEWIDLRNFNELASKKLCVSIQKRAYSQLDLRPAYGVIFDEYIKGFDFWGHCDIDVVWGDVRSFITESILKSYDIVSFRKNLLAGHLTLWRNIDEINTLFRAVPGYSEILSSSDHFNFDEAILSTFLKDQISTDSSKIRVYWPEEIVVSFYKRGNPNGWYWENGKIFDVNGKEHIYLHFQDWQKSVISIDFQIGDGPGRFKFTKSAIRSNWNLRDYLFYENFDWKELKGLIFSLIYNAVYLLRLMKKVLIVKDIYWAKILLVNSINIRDVQYDRISGGLYLKQLDIYIGKQKNFLLQGYFWALQLVEQRRTKFYINEQDELVADSEGMRIFIQSAEDLLFLKELLVDGIYNIIISEPSVVVDIGMNVGIAAIYFANQNEVLVVGIEPSEKQCNKALRNISLNPGLSDKIKVLKIGLDITKFKSIAVSIPKLSRQNYFLPSQSKNGGSPKFEYDEIVIEDAADILEWIAKNYQDKKIILKIDLERSEYFIDGNSEYHIINRLHNSGKLALIDTIMLEWHKRKPESDPFEIARQLCDYGFKILLFTPHNKHQGMLYAIQRDCPRIGT